MEHLSLMVRNVTVSLDGRLHFSTSSILNLIAHVEWKTLALALVASILVAFVKLVDGHGRLFDPPSRSTAWRVGFDTPKDYNDMEGFCGGFDRQWLVNNGRCGVCGDPYDEAIKPHEAPGGMFATGTIVRNYTQGEIIPVTIQITATHRGFYEFRLCPNNNPMQDPTQECFEKFPLHFVDKTGATSDVFSLKNLMPATYQVRLQLPPSITCKQCIIQTYVTGNRWGLCSDGTSRLGCGPQESFRACSDITINPTQSHFPDSSVGVLIQGSPNITLTPHLNTSHLTDITTSTIKSTVTTTSLNQTLTAKPSVSSPTHELFSQRPTKSPSRPGKPVRPIRPTQPSRPLRPTTPTRLTTRPTELPKPFTTLFTTQINSFILSSTPLTPAQISEVTNPTTTSRPSTSIDTHQSLAAKPTPNGTRCMNYIPVNSGIPGMVSWCNNNCRQGYCPTDFCKCAHS